MKLIFQFVFWGLAFIISLLPARFARANGFDNGNAGDAYSAEFIFSARDVLQRLELSAADGHPLYDTAKLRAAIQSTTVVSIDHVLVSGEERDAANFPVQKLIRISRTRWSDYRQANETLDRLKIALHEYLDITGVDDTHYDTSEKLIKALNVPDYSPAVWLATPGTPFAVAECTGQLPDGSYVTVTVTTKGATKAPYDAEVAIERGGNKFGYRFDASEIAQFFEFDDAKSNTAIVGLGAYVKREFPVSIQYSGPNFVDMDLKATIDAGGSRVASNSMRVWKGPGYAADDQYVLPAPVCSVGSNN